MLTNSLANVGSIKTQKRIGEIKMVKVYISPSSQEDNRGVGNYGTEEVRMNQIADVVERELKRVGITTLRNNPSMNITQMVTASNNFGADVHLAIHSNAGGGTGAEAYYYTGSTSSQKLAQAVYNNLAPMTPTGDRGVKATTQLYEVWATNAVATLVEIAFHDNSTDASFIVNNIQAIGIAIAKGVCSYFGIAFGNSQPATATPSPTPSSVTSGGFAVGSKVRIRPEATHYQTGETIVNWAKNTPYTILQVKAVNQASSKRAYLLSGIVSWVLEQDVLSASATVAPSTSYKVKVTTSYLNVRSGAGMNYEIVSAIKDFGVYTIVATSGEWGKLKSGTGWINLAYTKRV